MTTTSLDRAAMLRRRGYPMAAEFTAPTGQALLWYADVIMRVPLSGQKVARQLARLCGEDSRVTLPWRSLADAVGVCDAEGRLIAYTQRGVEVLVSAGWLRVETVGRGPRARTTFYLMPGDLSKDFRWLPDWDADTCK